VDDRLISLLVAIKAAVLIVANHFAT